MAFDGVFSLIIWQFVIPRFVVGWVQSILYSIFIRAGDRKPAYGSPKFNTHRKQILVTIYTAYCLFSLYEINHDMQSAGDHYKTLGVSLDVDDRKLASRFRRLTQQYHPDKISSIADSEAANNYYVHLMTARDILIDPLKRFAYDRFGPSALQCRNCLNTRDYVAFALKDSLLQYVMIIVGLAAANTLGYFKEGAYWRFLALFVLMTMEVRTALRPDHPAVLVNVFNPLLTTFSEHSPYLPFQAMALLRKGTYTLSIFLTLLISLYRVEPQQSNIEGQDSEEARHKQLDRLTQVAQDAQVDASRLLELETIPFKQDERVKGDLRNALKGWMVNNVIHGEKDVRNAIGLSLAKRRVGAPAGARGTK